jgi:hypothetical protein
MEQRGSEKAVNVPISDDAIGIRGVLNVRVKVAYFTKQ